jgi:hypothetical protein
MAGVNQYKCPNCEFVGKLGQLTKHLRENPEHWTIHCQECRASIVTKKDIARHEEETGHSTGLVSTDIINVQKTTKISTSTILKPATKKIKPATKKIKPATKKKLMMMGISEENATLLATGRNFTELKNLQVPSFVRILEDESWNEVLSIAKIIVPEPKNRIPHNKHTLETLMQTHDISNRDEILETALRFGKLRGGRIAKKQLTEAIKFLVTKNPHKNPDSVLDGENDRIGVIHQARRDVARRRNDAMDKGRFSKIVGFSVSNFKGFKEATESPNFVPIRPLTLVYGPNNGGKSSILKGFSSLGQTLGKVRLLQGNFDWSPNGMWYKLGASPHVLNDPANTEFILGFVLQNDEFQKSSGRKFHEIRFTFSLEANEGVLTSLEFRGGDFEDYLHPIMTIIRNDSEPTVQTSLFSQLLNRKSFKLEQYSPELMKKNVEMLDKQTKITTLILDFTSMLTDLENNDEFHGFRYECASCSFTSNNQKRMKNHLKQEHKLPNQPSNYKTLGFKSNVLLELDRFKVVAEDYFDRKAGNIQIEKDHGGENLLAMFKSCLQIPKKPGQHPKKFLNFEINLDEDLKEELLDNDSHINLITEDQVHSLRKWFGPPMSFSGSSVLETDVNILNALLSSLRKKLDVMDYLGATRLLPQRSYSSQTGGQSSQGVAGERTLAHLANNKKVQRWVNENLADIVGLNIKVKKRTTQITHHDGSKKTYPLDELDVRISRVDSSEDRLQLPDVGFGVSQLLPILAGIAVPGLLVVEEPESNLHPGAQQKLMKKIIEQIVANKNNGVMMETHSEHFLLEVLRAISDPECPLQDDDVAILYTYNTPEHGTVVKRHTTTNGTLNERFPREFTGDYGLSLI